MSMKESEKYQDIFLWVTKQHRTHVLGTAHFRSMNIKIRDVDSHHKEHRTVQEYLHGDICSNAIAEFSYSDFCRKWDHHLLRVYTGRLQNHKQSCHHNLKWKYPKLCLCDFGFALMPLFKSCFLEQLCQHLQKNNFMMEDAQCRLHLYHMWTSHVYESCLCGKRSSNNCWMFSIKQEIFQPFHSIVSSTT